MSVFVTILIALVALTIGAVVAGLYVTARLKGEVESWKSKYEISLQTAESQKQTNEHLQKQMSLQFENLAQKIFDQKSHQFSDLNQKQITGLLDPLKERIKDFEKKVEESYSTEKADRGYLKGEISKLIELNQTMSKEAHNLTTALKGENKTQGNWGEMILENILNRSGLRKDEEYLTQETVRNEHGEMLRPDVIVRLPEGKHIVVDSKMTLTAYEAAVSSTEEKDKVRFEAAHVEALKRHIQELSDKKYHSAGDLISPEFVLLFMPLEPAFAMAFKLKPELFEQAWEKNVAIVSPTTLLTTLKTVASLWKQERQQKNALEIAKRGGDLYDKFVGVLNEIDNVGDKLQSAVKAHTELKNKMSVGRGNLIFQVEKLKELGAKTEKAIPQSQLLE